MMAEPAGHGARSSATDVSILHKLTLQAGPAAAVCAAVPGGSAVDVLVVGRSLIAKDYWLIRQQDA